MKRSTHLGSPCVFCDQEYDQVAVGECPGRPGLDKMADMQLTIDHLTAQWAARITLPCGHGDDKRHTYLAIMDPAGEVYMCECGALVNIADTSYIDDGYLSALSMSPDELKKAISLIALEAIRHVKGGILRTINSIEQNWENKGR